MNDVILSWRHNSPSPFSRKSIDSPRSVSPCKLSPSEMANWCSRSHCERESRTVMATVSPLPRLRRGVASVSCVALLLCLRVKDASPVCFSLIEILPHPLPEFSDLLCGLAVCLKFCHGPPTCDCTGKCPAFSDRHRCDGESIRHKCLLCFRNFGSPCRTGIEDKCCRLSRSFYNIDTCGNGSQVKGRGTARYQDEIGQGDDGRRSRRGMWSGINHQECDAIVLCRFDNTRRLGR